MINITTFLDVNSKRLKKDIFYCPEHDARYTSKDFLSIIY